MNLVQATIGFFTDPANWSGPFGIPTRLQEHIFLSVGSLLIAALVALPLGLWIGHTGRGATFVANSVNLWRALPSLAVMGLAAPFLQQLNPQIGFTTLPVLVAMVILAGPPILLGAYSGVRGVDRDLVEAARGMGMRERQVLTRVEVPVALPVIVTGLRSAAVQVVATATLGAIFGFGGLGRFLIDGVDQQDDGQIWAGVVLVAVLALATSGALALVERMLTPAGLRRRPGTERVAAAPAATEA